MPVIILILFIWRLIDLILNWNATTDNIFSCGTMSLSRLLNPNRLCLSMHQHNHFNFKGSAMLLRLALIIQGQAIPGKPPSSRCTICVYHLLQYKGSKLELHLCQQVLYYWAASTLTTNSTFNRGLETCLCACVCGGGYQSLLTGLFKVFSHYSFSKWTNLSQQKKKSYKL